MIFQIKTINGQKTIVPLTADTGAGAPVGSLIAMYKKSSPSGYLYCDGSTFDQTKYPALYQYLGSNVLPDYRECVAVGAEQNTTDTIATHDVYTEGQFKDDQLQNHAHNNTWSRRLGTYFQSVTSSDYEMQDNPLVSHEGVYGARTGTTTHGKQKAVFIYIKATSGLTENQQENVLNTINKNLSYSTAEHKTGRKWIDGKDIWSKTVIFGALPNTSQKAVAHNIANVSEITKQEGYFTNEITFFPLPYVDNGNTRVQMFTDKTNIQITTYTDLSSYSATVTLEYTKTTDN